MSTGIDAKKRRSGGPIRWIAAGFVGAFAASVLTVIYTGLMVEGSRSDFDSGFRSAILRVAETGTVDLVFDSSVSSADATLALRLPAPVALTDSPERRDVTLPVSLDVGRNVYPVELVGLAPGSGYLVARLAADRPVGTERVFVTVTEAAPQ